MTPCTRFLLSCTLSLILLPGAQAQTRQSFGAWSVVCSGGATGYCSASNRIKSVAGPYRFQLNVSRERPGADFELALLTGYQHPGEGSVITVQVDAGKPLKLAPREGYRRAGRSNTYIVAAGETERLLKQMRAGSRVQFRFEDTKGATVNATFPLAGLSGATGLMDKMQPAPRQRTPKPAAAPAAKSPVTDTTKPTQEGETVLSPKLAPAQEPAPARTATPAPIEKGVAPAPTPAPPLQQATTAPTAAPVPSAKQATPAPTGAAVQPSTQATPAPTATPAPPAKQATPAPTTVPAPIAKETAPARTAPTVPPVKEVPPVPAAPVAKVAVPAPTPAPAPLAKEVVPAPAAVPAPVATEPTAPVAKELTPSAVPPAKQPAAAASASTTARAPIPEAKSKPTQAQTAEPALTPAPAQAPASDPKRKSAAQKQAAVNTAPTASRKRGAKSIRQFSCRGNEPSWTFVIDGERARYASLTEPDPIELAGKLNVTGDGPTPIIDWRGKSDWGGSFRALVTEGRCRDSMSDSEGQTEFEYLAQVTLPGGKSVRGCCNAGLPPVKAAAPADTTQYPVADLRTRAETDWSRYLFDLLPAIQACIDKTPEPDPYATKAWPMNHGMVGVRTRNGQGGWFECVAEANGKSIDRFVTLPPSAPLAPNEDRVVFSPPDHAAPGGKCYKHERVMDGMGDFMGWLSTNVCS